MNWRTLTATLVTVLAQGPAISGEVGTVPSDPGVFVMVSSD